jgi:hypothetical protein
VRLTTLALCVSVAAVIASVGTPLAACYNGDERRLERRTQALVAAEQALRSGDYAAAATHALSVNSNLLHANESLPLAGRALRVLALVTVRTGGLWPSHGKLSAKDSAERARHLDWAVSKLRRRQIADLGHPGKLSDLGEALAARPALHEEALGILEHLASRDLITSAHGYAALGRLRAAKGDSQGSEHAFERCRKLSELQGVCGSDVRART